MLGVAGVALGSYVAYAGNSATMTVTATIAHDVSLNVDHDLNMGTITVNPGADWSLGGGVDFSLDGTGTVTSKTSNIISVTGFSAGTFTANVPDSCKVNGGTLGFTSFDNPCFRATSFISLGNTDVGESYIVYDSGNKFKFQFNFIRWNDNIVPQSGTFDEDIEIEYIL